MVARRTGTTCRSLALTLVTYSKPSTPLETIPSEVAPRGVIIPSSMSQPILQNGLYQTAAVLDQLCNHKLAIAAWSSGQDASAAANTG